MKKKLLMMLAAALICANSFAQTIGTEIEPNDVLAEANLLTLGSYASNAVCDTGCHTAWEDADYYRIHIPRAGVLNVTIPPCVTGGFGMDISIIDSATNTVISHNNGSTPVISEAVLCGGAYYIEIGNCCSGGWIPGTFTYQFTATFYPDSTECNNTPLTAYPVNGNDTVIAYLRGVNFEDIPSPHLDLDKYKVYNTGCGFLTTRIPLNSTGIQFQIQVTDSASGSVISTNIASSAGAAVTDTVSIPFGTYYIEVSSDNEILSANPYTLYVNLSDCASLGASMQNTVFANTAISPNPSNGNFTVNLPAMGEQVVITNIIGQKVMEIPANQQSAISISLNQPPGLYFMAVTSGDSRKTYKIAVSK